MNGMELIARILGQPSDVPNLTRLPVYTDEGEVRSVSVRNGCIILSATDATEATDACQIDAQPNHW